MINGVFRIETMTFDLDLGVFLPQIVDFSIKRKLPENHKKSSRLVQ